MQTIAATEKSRSTSRDEYKLAREAAKQLKLEEERAQQEKIRQKREADKLAKLEMKRKQEEDIKAK